MQKNNFVGRWVDVRALGGGRRHLEGLNLLFVDGHVKWFRSETDNAGSRITAGSATIATAGNNASFSRLES